MASSPSQPTKYGTLPNMYLLPYPLMGLDTDDKNAIVTAGGGGHTSSGEIPNEVRSY